MVCPRNGAAALTVVSTYPSSSTTPNKSVRADSSILPIQCNYRFAILEPQSRLGGTMHSNSKYFAPETGLQFYQGSTRITGGP